MITFQSRATASVMMFNDVAEQLLRLMGKDFTPEGIVTLAQLPAAIEALDRAARDDRQRARAAPAEDEDQDADAEDTPPPARPVSLSQRAVPLIDMMKQSLAAGEPVVWRA